jgi:hypothetical protein
MHSFRTCNSHQVLGRLNHGSLDGRGMYKTHDRTEIHIKIYSEKLSRKRLGKPKRRWVHNIKVNLVYWIYFGSENNYWLSREEANEISGCIKCGQYFH